MIWDKKNPISICSYFCKQDRISTDLIKLRNFSFAVFFLLNSLYVATIFGFQMKSENAPAESPHFSEVKYYVI